MMRGGPSHVDTFDYKPKLTADTGNPGRRPGTKLLGSKWAFKQHGQSGLWVSELFPNVAEQADDLCPIRSMQTDLPSHPQAFLQLHTGSSRFIRPSLGAWTTYGLGSLNENVPGFVTITPPSDMGGAQNYGSAFLQAIYQGRKCLLGRRMAEAGVRFVEVSHGNWDQHFNLETSLAANAHATDKPIAGLLADLKSRDMLKDTLVIWAGEFGRTPHAQGGDGRDHNNKAFTIWMAGGGIRGGMSYGSTDDSGYETLEHPVQIHDLHATILALLGLDHEALTYRFAGRDFRLTDTKGNVLRSILAS
jgi:hypothetical protein